MDRSGSRRRKTVALACVLLNVVLLSGSSEGHGLKGRGHRLGKVKTYGCPPRVHYVTHYQTKYQDIPIYKVITTHDLEVRAEDAVIYSTLVDVHTRSLTTTVTKTTTQYLTRVSRNEVTETVTRLLSIPDYTTATKILQQSSTVDLTSRVYSTVSVPYPVTVTEVATVSQTVTAPVTYVEKSGLPVFRDHLLIDTSVHFLTVTHTQTFYNNDVVYVTDNVVDFQPSYATRTEYRTSYVTHTAVSHVPSYVMETVHAPCNSYY